MSESKATRTYLRADCVTFRKTNETFGGLSNMASGYPVRVNGVMILTVEALYQACRFPHRPQVQRMIIGQRSPMTAKMVGKPYRDDSRPDWDRVRVKIMRWCLRLKLATHWTRFSQLLLSTGDRAIVEDSRKDQFWGAVPNDTSILVGMNVLGRLLMELRESIKEHTELRLVEPPAIPNFLLFEQCMTASDFRTEKRTPAVPDPIIRELPTEELALQFSSHVSNSSLIAHDAHGCGSDTVEGRANLFSGLKPYPSYIKTGNKWFASMPSSWNFLSLRHIAKPISECGRADLDLLSVYLNRGVIRYSESGGQVHKPSLDLSKYQVVCPGNFVLNNQQAWRGSVGVSRYLGIIGPAYNVLKLSSQIQSSYADYMFRSVGMVAQYVVASRGVGDIQRNLYFPDLRRSVVIIPPLAEQASIVRFLNLANGKINDFICAKRKLIALLVEQKQAIIYRAITRGTHPDVPTKPSGVLWLDSVPEHWSMTSNRRLFRIRKVLVGSRHKEYHVLSLTKRGIIVRDMEAGGKFSNFWERSQEVRPGDLVFCFFDVDETPRAVGLSHTLGMISPDYTVMECLDKLTASFLEYFYMAMDDHKMLRPLYTGLRKRISKPLFLAAKTPIPPTEEMRSILTFIKDALSETDKSLEIIAREITLMQEYRTRLTADIVTGKLDVREAAENLPDLSGTMESIEAETPAGESIEAEPAEMES